jgi:hypothetical protein
VSVLDLVAKYTATNDQELFGIMNLLDPCLRASNAAVVLATTKCFITYTATRPAVLQQVFTRLKTPLLTLVATATQETGYVVLKHVETIVERAPTVFDSEFKQFFCKYSDPPSVQKIKLRILPMVADDTNTQDIISELSEYVSGVDSDIAAHAVRAIGDIALRVATSVDTVVATLLEVLDLDLDADWVRSQTVIVMQTLLRRHPSRAPSVIPALHKALTQVSDGEGRSAVIWMIGEYGDMLDDAPYMLEPLIDSVVAAAGIGGVATVAADGGEDIGTQVKLELLTSTLKLFFKRPPEVKAMLGRLMKATLEADEEEAAVRDRALLYYRLLRRDPAEAAAVVGASSDHVAAGAFLPDMSAAEKDAIFAEFNSLSVVYDRRASAFIADRFLAATVAPSEPQQGAAAGTAAASAPGASATHSSGGGGGGDDLDDLLGGGAPAVAPTVPNTVGDFDEFDLLGGAAPAPAPAPAPVPSASAAPIMTPDVFKAQWAQWAVSASAKFGLTPPGDITGGVVKQALTAADLRDVAAGDTGSHVKFFVVGADSCGSAHLVELLVVKAAAGSTNPEGVQITVKSAPGGDVAGFATALRSALLPLGLQ